MAQLKMKRPGQGERTVGYGKLKPFGVLLDRWGKEAAIEAYVWDRPKDFPRNVCIRFWAIPQRHLNAIAAKETKPQSFGEVMLFPPGKEGIQDARAAIKRVLPGHVLRPRDAADDLFFVESWAPRALEDATGLILLP